MSSMRETNLMYGEGQHPVHGTWLSVDVIALTEDSPSKVVLITREGEPHSGSTTLPGGLLAAWDGETVEDAALRIVREKVGVEALTNSVAVLGVVSDPKRDERGHTVSVLVGVRVPAGTRGAVRLADVPDGMPFGHNDILKLGVRRIRERVLTERDTTLALLGHITTVRKVIDLLTGCSSTPPSDSALRSRLERSHLYMRDDYSVIQPRIGRPQSVYHMAPEIGEK